MKSPTAADRRRNIIIARVRISVTCASRRLLRLVYYYHRHARRHRCSVISDASPDHAFADGVCHLSDAAPGSNGPRGYHIAHPEQRAGHGGIPQTTVVAVRPERERPPDTRVRRAARRQVRAADRTHRPGPGRQTAGAPGTAGGQGHLVRPAAAKRACSFRRGRRLPAATVSATVPAGAGVSDRICTKTMMMTRSCCSIPMTSVDDHTSSSIVQ